MGNFDKSLDALFLLEVVEKSTILWIERLKSGNDISWTIFVNLDILCFVVWHDQGWFIVKV